MQINQLLNYRKYYFGAFLIILITGVITTYCTVVFGDQESPFEQVRVKVPEGATLASIAKLLENQKVISDAKSFLLTAKILGKEKSIPAGVFTLVDANSNNSVIQQMVNGSPHLHYVTLIEGWTIKDIAVELEQKLAIDGDQFVQLCQDSLFISSLKVPVKNSLEGFLLPETYQFFEGQDEKEIIRRLVQEYHKNFDDDMKLVREKTGLSELEVVTLASIIEGEAIFDIERPIIAAVYYNRLKKRMRLQADPTIQYIIEGPPRRLLRRDLNINSPYNTYKYYGLPPGPINNPGAMSIKAALDPDEADYLYFVARGDGYHTFTNTQREHNLAKRKFQQVRRKVARDRKLKLQEKIKAQ